MSTDPWPVEALRGQLDALLPGCGVEVVDEIDSTNTELMRRARTGAGEPVLLVARRQTAGRGRMGRTWESGADVERPSSLTFSLGVPLAPRDWSGLSLAVGVAVAQALDANGQIGLALKWPNDLWVHDRKLGGILIETAIPQSDATQSAGADPASRYAVIGVGLNLGPRDAQGMSTPPAWLREWQPEASPQGVLDQVAAPLLSAVLEFADHGFARFAERFIARDALRGRDVQLSDGTLGRCEGVGWGGELLVHTEDGMKTISSSEVSVRPRREAT
ncbi:biotin--[acetyl-CoA-carboxylase] ligase [Variovorax sp. J22R133]|uniref:biotin--[acetyl-CoA-carboxylase] ligase n=1 Tax=Variovorax brevis TaxID=3053503 RepID=UPI002574D5D0|nr:biotin--[acetyl-CoA-carboxylase] ligase [Variovorax sp. J22R133]MDM0115235.1 biotin--[acetyl-CoA-carboxylase] ligase [Variovorax sp. J22R133]